LDGGIFDAVLAGGAGVGAAIAKAAGVKGGVEVGGDPEAGRVFERDLLDTGSMAVARVEISY
jgi:hypothetical protein